MSSSNTIRIGFIDILTAFLCSTVILMIVIAYSLNKSAEIKGSPQDFLYNTIDIKVEENLAGFESLDFLDSLQIQILVEAPDGKKIQSKFIGQKMLYIDGLIPLYDPQTGIKDTTIYAWGPQYKQSAQGRILRDVISYTIYATSNQKKEVDNQWHIAIRTISSDRIEKKKKVFSSGNIRNSLHKKIRVTHHARTLDIDTTVTSQILYMGEVFSVKF